MSILEKVLQEQKVKMRKDENDLIDREINARNKERGEEFMSAKDILDEYYKEFVKPFPEHAYKAIPGGAGLTSLKPQFVVERLNQVCGLNGWRFEQQSNEKHEKDIVVRGVLLILHEGQVIAARQASGGHTHRNGSLGDAYKSADTDALSKAASPLWNRQ